MRNNIKEKPYCLCSISIINNWLWAVLFCWLVSADSCSNTNHAVYEQEKLLLKYMDKYHPQYFTENEFFMFTFRTKHLCRTCRTIPLDTVLKYAIEDKGALKMYVLVDNEKDMAAIMSLYSDKVQCVCGDATLMDKYGVPPIEPLLFRIKNKRIVEVKDYFEH